MLDRDDYLSGLAVRLGTRVGLLFPHNVLVLAPVRWRPSLASPYLAGILAVVKSRTHHVVGDHAGVEHLALSGAQDGYSGAAQAFVVLHYREKTPGHPDLAPVSQDRQACVQMPISGPGLQPSPPSDPGVLPEVWDPELLPLGVTVVPQPATWHWSPGWVQR